MMERQRHLPFSDFQGDRRHREVKIDQGPFHPRSVGEQQRGLSQPRLDGKLPDRSSTDDQFVGRVFENGDRPGPEFAWIILGP
jgi:hypothetical protein